MPEHPAFFPEDATSDQPETFYVAEVVRENGHEACYVRPIAFYGSEKMGVSPVGA